MKREKCIFWNPNLKANAVSHLHLSLLNRTASNTSISKSSTDVTDLFPWFLPSKHRYSSHQKSVPAASDGQGYSSGGSRGLTAPFAALWLVTHLFGGYVVYSAALSDKLGSFIFFDSLLLAIIFCADLGFGVRCWNNPSKMEGCWSGRWLFVFIDTICSNSHVNATCCLIIMCCLLWEVILVIQIYVLC